MRHSSVGKNAKSFVLILVFFIFVSFIIKYPKEAPDSLRIEDVQYVTLGGQEVKVEVATSNEAQTRGLSGRDSLKPDEGMLFYFEEPGKYSFWMKDMKFPIDIIWADKDSRIIYIKESAEPDSYPATFGPDALAQYVLELPAGFTAKNKVKVGDQLNFEF